MSIWRQVMAKCEEAKRTMLQDRPAGEMAFAALLRDHPDDGMVHFKRAEAYEHLGAYSIAEGEYARAERLFPWADWKARARAARERAATAHVRLAHVR